MYRKIHRFFQENPQASTRQAARRFNVSQYFIWKLLNTSGMYPYHFQRVQDIALADYRPQRNFVNGCWKISITTFYGVTKPPLRELDYLTFIMNIGEVLAVATHTLHRGTLSKCDLV
ncbi:hypothetical protein PYW08_012786 [Mythimna loreyi]|uniref:Uncharacterized protein n=1 Tax=Mythimna loreyi TaxID=667449 RepID=A0ACC2Q4S4_9NEOP|nr:hypothetical protein PYW08_012786 [Mythimna loreyi]